MTAVRTDKKKNTIRNAAGDRIFYAIIYIIAALTLVLFLYPLLWVLVSSVSGGIMMSGLSLIPKQVSWEGYKAVFEHEMVLSGYKNSIIYTVSGSVVAMIVTILCAYPLSRSDFKRGGIFMALCMFTMYFEGGLIPTYLLIRSLGMLDTIWAIILPVSLSVYNMIVMRTYFSSQIPNEMREAAQIDGCGDWRFLIQIVLPLSGPILAVIFLYYAVALWNSYFNAMIYIKTRTKLPLSNILRELLILSLTPELERGLSSEALAQMEKRAEVMKYSLIVVASLPMLILYPFIQKYFVKGVMIGAVKG